VQDSSKLSPTDRIDILIVDDHVLLADTVSAALVRTGGFEVHTAHSLLDAQKQIAEYGPFDVVLLDYELPGVRGLQGLHELIESNGRGVVLFSGVAGAAIVIEAVEAGAVGFVPKTLPLNVLVHTLRFISAGGTYIPSDFVSRHGEMQDNLKPRERKVLMLLLEGYQNKEIALAAGITEATVKND